MLFELFSQILKETKNTYFGVCVLYYYQFFLKTLKWVKKFLNNVYLSTAIAPIAMEDIKTGVAWKKKR